MRWRRDPEEMDLFWGKLRTKGARWIEVMWIMMIHIIIESDNNIIRICQTLDISVYIRKGYVIVDLQCVTLTWVWYVFIRALYHCISQQYCLQTQTRYIHVMENETFIEENKKCLKSHKYKWRIPSTLYHFR